MSFVSVASLLLWAAAFLYFRSYLKRRTGPDRLLAEFREEVEKLVAEIDAATDRDATLVEERVRTLRATLEEADRRIASYRRELDRRAAEERAYAELGRRAGPLRSTETDFAPSTSGSLRGSPNAVKPIPAARVQEPAPERSQERLIEGAGEADAGQEKGEAEPSAGSGPRFVRSATPVEPKAPPFAERVAELHRAGFSADLIAKRLGATVAEVDLAIALTGRGE